MRAVLVLLDIFADFKTVQIGEVPIEEDQIGLALDDHVQPLAAGFRNIDDKDAFGKGFFQ